MSVESTWVEFEARIVVDRVTWIGKGWREITAKDMDWQEVALGVSYALQAGVTRIVQGAEYRFDLSGQVFTADEELTKRLRRYRLLADKEVGDGIAWTMTGVLPRGRQVPSGQG